MGQKVHIEWFGDLDAYRVLYAYQHPTSEEILYIGKADRCSFRERLGGSHKKAMFTSYLGTQPQRNINVLVGNVVLDEGNRLSRHLLSDIESLLIYRLKPPLNTHYLFSRTYSRPGMILTCGGEWPKGERACFIDRCQR